MAEVKVKRSAEREVIAKAKQGVCLCCERPAARRGLCNGCYLKFNRAKNEQPRKKRIEFEESHIREGRILAAGQIVSIKNPNPFSEAG